MPRQTIGGWRDACPYCHEIIQDEHICSTLQESTVDPDLLNRVRTLRPPLTHDLRPATGSCGRCNEPAIAKCYTIGCAMACKMCAKHLTEGHDGKTLPEGVPHG